jgi:hypothetical protein
MKRVLGVFTGGSLALALGALPAIAQETSAPPQPGTIVQQGDVNEQFPEDGKADQVDRVAGVGPQRPGMFAPEGVKRVSPGALLFASFDRNFDGRITRQEIEVGATGAFAAADRNRDGKVTGFEQNDWAVSVGSPNDVLANAMTFDIDMDRTVTPAEFLAGLKRIADQVMGMGGTEIAFSELVKPLNQADRQADGGPELIDPRARGRNVSPNGLQR